MTTRAQEAIAAASARRAEARAAYRAVSIPVTDQMIYAFAGEPEITATDAHTIRVGLVAVLELVAQDYERRADKGHTPGCVAGVACEPYCEAKP